MQLYSTIFRCITYLGMRREDAQTSWSKRGAPLSVPQLAARLIEILKMYKRKTVPDKLETTMPRQKQLPRGRAG